VTLASRTKFLTVRVETPLVVVVFRRILSWSLSSIHPRLDPSLAIFSTRALTLFLPSLRHLPPPLHLPSSPVVHPLRLGYSSRIICAAFRLSRAVSRLLTLLLSAWSIPHDGPIKIASTTPAIVYLLCITGYRSRPTRPKAPLHR
jgi:hypothetical protein